MNDKRDIAELLIGLIDLSSVLERFESTDPNTGAELWEWKSWCYNKLCALGFDALQRMAYVDDGGFLHAYDCYEIDPEECEEVDITPLEVPFLTLGECCERRFDTFAIKRMAFWAEMRGS